MALAGPSFRTLDLASCVHLKPRTLCRALRATPQLRALDLSGCCFTSELVYALPWAVPALTTLRLSGDAPRQVELRAWEQLVPPTPTGSLPGAAGGSWDDDAGDTASQSGRPARAGLAELRWLCWPDIPRALASLFAGQWARLRVNAHDAPARAVRESVPSTATPSIALDAEILTCAVAATAWRGLDTAEAAPLPELHIADKFWSAVKEVERKAITRALQLQAQAERADPLERQMLLGVRDVSISGEGRQRAPPRAARSSRSVLSSWLDSCED